MLKTSGLTMLLLCAVGAHAAEVRVLSAGAVEPGLKEFARVVKTETGHDLKIQFNTAPQIAARLAAGETYDLLLSPPAAIAQAVTDGRVVAGSRVPVGRVGVGIITRAAATAPVVATPDALKQALLAADSVVYNTASTGLYLDKLFNELGIAAQLKPKTTRYPDGASVMEHVIKGSGNEIGFGAITEIRSFEARGVKLIGPLPAAIQNFTSYEAALMTNAAAADAAQAVLRALAAPSGKAAFLAGGVE